MTIADLIQQSHATAVEKGWWEKDRPFSEGIALMHSELSEALEAWRVTGMKQTDPGICGIIGREDFGYLWYESEDGGTYARQLSNGERPPLKPEGIAAELADVLIRIGDWCGRHGIPLEDALLAKLAYNRTRPHRHGGKLA